MSVSETSPPLAEALQECIGMCPAIGFVVCGNTGNARNQGTVTSFQRKDGKVWATSESYGKGRPPHNVWKCGERELVDVVTETIMRLMTVEHDGATLTWQAWEYEYPHQDNQECHPYKSFMTMVFSGSRGIVALSKVIPKLM